MSKVIETIELSKVFKDFWGRPKVRALEKLTFSVHSGEIFGLLGPNGAGKSTTIKLLLGFLFPTYGKVSIFGGSPRNVRNKTRIGFLPEESYLYPYQNAEEALMFYGKLFKLPDKICKKRVDSLLDMVGLSRVRKRYLKEYSKGMARRIGIAQALINDPDLIILDEPTSGLDPIGTREIKDLILELKRRNKTVLLCSHLLADVEDLCDRVTILYGGRKSCEGKMSELLKNQNITQITSEKLSPEALEKLQTWFTSEGIQLHSVGNPDERLETFFLKTIEKARAEQQENSGADAGKKIQNFLDDVQEEKSGEALIDSLIKKAEPQQTAVVSEEPEENTEILSELLQKDSPEKAPETKPEIKQENLEVLDNLIHKKDK